MIRMSAGRDRLESSFCICTRYILIKIFFGTLPSQSLTSSRYNTAKQAIIRIFAQNSLEFFYHSTWADSSNVSVESISAVTEFLVSIDPGVYRLDPASQLQWMDPTKLLKFMTRTEVVNFLNAISGQYTGELVITTNYEDFLIITQCHCSKKISVWVYTRDPNPSDDVVAVVNQHLDNRLFEYRLKKNEACQNSLDRMFQNAHPK